MFEKLCEVISSGEIVEATNIIKENKGLVTATDSHGLTALHHANTREACELLISYGAKVDAQDKSGRTPLHWAAVKGKNPDFINSLVESGANIDMPSGKNRNTPLHYAAQYGQVGALEALIKKGADKNVINSQMQTCLDVCKDPKTAKALGDLLRDKDAQKYQKMADVTKGNSMSKQK